MPYQKGIAVLVTHRPSLLPRFGGEMSSNASVTCFSALAGIRSPKLGPLTLALNVGAIATVGRRSIDNCVA